MEEMIGDVISETQNAFVKNRQILDFVLITNECLDSSLKSGVMEVLCKLDVEKSYDHMNWGFLISMLEQFGFPENGYFFCISMGDPLYLFVIVMEAVSKMMDKVVREGRLFGFSVDNTLVICNADLDQLLFLRLILSWFEIVLGLKINWDKFELVPMGGVPNFELLVVALGCKQGSLPMKYLGLPLGAKCKDKAIWNPIIEKVEKRLARWKRMSLSKGVDIANLLEELKRNFLWSCLRDDSKRHLANWSKFEIGDGTGVKFWHDV
ncbi:uncharacterized protein LOC136067847 [Quercus suber]|uniref:uncharacterized protein LOC136067847 n=1 Tax=Quercus suber TaxID=58331 RepID=UPI0032DF6762